VQKKKTLSIFLHPANGKQATGQVTKKDKETGKKINICVFSK